MAKDLGFSFEKASNSNDKKLLNISLWANRFSWVILFLYTIDFLARTAFQIQEIFGEWSVKLSISFLANLLAIPVIGIIYFLILQTISGGVLILMDNNNLELIRALNVKRNNAIQFIPHWANVLSWVVLSLNTIYFLINLALYYPLIFEKDGGYELGYMNELGMCTQLFITLAIGIVYFLILQTIASSILIFKEKSV